MKAKPRVALCLSGFPRIMRWTFPYLKRYVLDVLQPDVFYYGYSDEKNGITCEDILNTYKPKDWSIREWNIFEENHLWNVYGTRDVQRQVSTSQPINIIGQYFNMRGSIGLKSISEWGASKYDCVIRARTDYFFCRDITIDEVSYLKSSTVYIPKIWDFGGVSSGFAYGDSESMDKYGELFSHLREYNLEHKRRFHPETIKAYHLGQVGLTRQPVEPHYFWAVKEFIGAGYESSILDPQHIEHPCRRKFL